jgi:DNA-binding NtrC family response regulator
LAPPPGLQGPTKATEALSTLEREHVLEVLERVGGNKMAAARILGVSRRALYRRLERYSEDT